MLLSDSPSIYCTHISSSSAVHKPGFNRNCCNVAFTDRVIYIDHWQRNHSKRKATFSCPICNMAFDNK